MTTTRIARHALIGAAVALLAATGLGACGDDDDTAASTSETTEAEAQLEISGAWARSSPAVAEAGAVYLEVSNPGPNDIFSPPIYDRGGMMLAALRCRTSAKVAFQ